MKNKIKLIRGITMKKVVSLVLALIMIAAIIAPIVANAEELSKEEVLFNKLLKDFSVFSDVDLDELKSLLTEDWFVETTYNIFLNGLAENEELKVKLSEEKGKVKEHILELFSEENVTVLLNELKSSKADKSLSFIKDFIDNIEKTLDAKWEDVIKLGSTQTAKDILAGIESEVEEALKPAFSDIGSHWSKSYVEAMAKAGIINGYEDGTFRPEGTITRAEFAKMLVLALELEIVKYEDSFEDVVAGSWYADFVATLVSNEIVQGYEDNTFKPAGLISRSEIAKMIAGALDVEITEEEVDVLLNGYKDKNEIPNWAKDAVAKVSKLKIMEGSEGNFNPAGNAKRGEAAAVIYRIINN